ncbi:hypothetical protein [Oceanobacillus profundus]|uniref:DUF5683 domain-containing protein n=1 Tax=Oceanobacillus profundus TaxID=372463 RepID=A0A417YCQ0_9BACI|nr:hypothetical protein [Oceanobacillus profundus]RHW30381.1 hypothetical protein D1B32_17580 [Oceanobacillus profundus]
MADKGAVEKLLWSIAFPGFGQLLNKKYFKGIMVIFLEILINLQGHLNNVVVLSYHGKIEQAIQEADYQWILFYPCVYFFAMWDAYKDAGGGKRAFSFLPFVFSAYFVTFACMFSSELTLFGVLLGPIWLSTLGIIPGVIVGFILQTILLKATN